MVSARRSHTEKMVAVRILKNVLPVVLLRTAVEEADAAAPRFVRGPIIQLFVIAAPNSEKKVRIQMAISALYPGVEVIDLHRNIAASGKAFMMHGVSTAIFKVALQRFERVLPIVVVS